MFTRLELEAIAGVILVIAACLGLHFYDQKQQALGAANNIAQQATRALAGEQAARSESERRVIAIQQKADHAEIAASSARADADAARSSDDRLRQRLAALSRATPVHPAASDPGAPATSAADLYADVLSRTLEAARLIGAFADESSIAGQACQQSYSELSNQGESRTIPQ